jgi:hypothetical protein
MKDDYSLQCLSDLLHSSKRQIAVIDYWDASPHLETSLEICLRLSIAGKNVSYYHWGDKLLLVECFSGTDRVHQAIRLANEYLVSIRCKKIVDDSKYVVAINKTPDIWPAFSHMEEVRNFSWNGQPAGISVTSTLCDIYKCSSLDYRDRRCQEITSNGLSTFKTAFELTTSAFCSNPPDAVVLFNGRYPSYSGSRYAAMKLGIPTFYHERGSDNNRFIFTRQMPHSVSEMNTRLKYAGYQIMSSNEDVTSCQNWFERRSIVSNTDIQKLRGLLTNHPISNHSGFMLYSFFVSSNDEISSLPSDVYPEMYWPCQLSAILDIASLLALYKPSALLAVRLHPNLVHKNPSELEQYEAISLLPNVILFSADDTTINSYALVNLSNYVFVYCSTIGIEAAQMGKTVYTLAPTYYDLLKVTTPIRSRPHLKEIIDGHSSVDAIYDLDISKKYRCSIYSQYQMLSGIPYKFYTPLGSNKGLFLANTSLN